MGAKGAEISTLAPIPQPDNSLAERIGRITVSLADGNRDAARRHLKPLIGITLQTDPVQAMPALKASAIRGAGGHATKNPSIPVIASIFKRDGFTCLYCGRRTVPTQILRLISFAFPDEFPYHKNWRGDITPHVYWDISTSLDHIHSVSTGGSWNDAANLATSCWRCNFQKSDRSAESLGWKLRPAANGWDGLTSHYSELWNRLGRPEVHHHAPWIRSFDAAAPVGTPPVQRSKKSQRVPVPELAPKNRAARPRKHRRRHDPLWNAESVVREIGMATNPNAARAAEGIINWVAEHPRLEAGFGGGPSMGSFKAGFTGRSGYVSCFDIWTYGKVEILFKFMGRHRPFDDLALRQGFQARLNAIPGVEIDDALLSGRPNLALDLFSGESELSRFVEAIDWWSGRLLTTES